MDLPAHSTMREVKPSRAPLGEAVWGGSTTEASGQSTCSPQKRVDANVSVELAMLIDPYFFLPYPKNLFGNSMVSIQVGLGPDPHKGGLYISFIPPGGFRISSKAGRP